MAQVARDQHIAIYIVGGFVRDLLLDRPSLDFDIVVEGDAIALARALSSCYGGRITSHQRFGTAKWRMKDFGFLTSEFGLPADQTTIQNLKPEIDLISARTEFYTHPTALPTVERGSIKLDLHRRDFTINTLALRLDGRHYGDLYDYWGGLTDLRQGLVRVLHSISFVDDPTRMLRAVRFEQRFDFEIEDRTCQLLQEALPLIHRVSGDRLRHELNHILDEPCVCQMIERLAELRLLTAIHPDLTWDAWLCDRVAALPGQFPAPEWGFLAEQGWAAAKRELIYALWVVRLTPERASSVLTRLKVPRHQFDQILEAIALLNDIPRLVGAHPSEIVSRLDGMHPMARFTVYHTLAEEQSRNLIWIYVTRWAKITPTINGNDLQARGLPPGPVYRTILTALRNAWLDGEINTVEAECALLEKLITTSS